MQSRPGMKTKISAFLIAVGLVLGAGTASADDWYSDDAPPASYEVYDSSEYHRTGYVWVSGHWQLRRGTWIWVPGHYERERAGYQYVQGQWDRDGDGWRYRHGQWHRV